MINKTTIRPILFILLIIIFNPLISAKISDFTLYFFWGDGCSHCEKAKGFIV